MADADRTREERDLLGGPLLTWVAPLPPSGIQHETRGTLLDDSGDDEAAPATLFADESFVSSAVFTGDAFLVTSSVRHDIIAHVALDGTVTIPEQAAIPADEYPHDAQLVWTGAEAAVLFWRNPLWAWAPVDASGGISGPLVALALEAYPRTALARGNEMWIVGSSGNSGINLAVTRISSTGEHIAPPLTVVADPEVPFLPAVAGLGRDRLIVALDWRKGLVPRTDRARAGLTLKSISIQAPMPRWSSRPRLSVTERTAAGVSQSPGKGGRRPEKSRAGAVN